MLTSAETDGGKQRVVCSGASAYFYKNMPENELLQTILPFALASLTYRCNWLPGMPNISARKIRRSVDRTPSSLQ